MSETSDRTWLQPAVVAIQATCKQRVDQSVRQLAES